MVSTRLGCLIFHALAQRLFHGSRIAAAVDFSMFKALAQRLFGRSRIAASSILNRNPMKQGKIIAPDTGISLRYIHRRSRSAWGENMMEKLREMDGCREKIRLLALEKEAESKLMVKEAVKILKLAQLERVRSRLKLIEKNSVSYSEYLEICAKDCSSFEQGVELAEMLDQSGSVIVLGNTVILRPEQLVLLQHENLMGKLGEMEAELLQHENLMGKLGEMEAESNLMVKYFMKIQKLALLEWLRLQLKLIEKNSVSYSEYLEICAKDCFSFEQVVEHAKMLDQSGSVIVLGNTVMLRPEQVLKAIEGLFPVPNQSILDDSFIAELQQLENQKASIDRKSMSLIRRELWFGLAALVGLGQTATFIRLTFWELLWDVMKPICLFVLPFYLIGILKTAKEHFQKLFQSRFRTKQEQLMRLQAFDIKRYNKLKKTFYPKYLEDQEFNFSFLFGAMQ